MYTKLKLIGAALALGLLTATAASAQTIVVNPGHHHWRHARMHCINDGGVWRHGTCFMPGVTTYRYGRTYYNYEPNRVYYRGGYWRDGVWYRY